MIHENQWMVAQGRMTAGSLGIGGARIQIYNSAFEFDIENKAHDKLSEVMHNAVDAIHNEMVAIVIAQDPKNAERAAKERADLLACFPESPINVFELPNGYDSSGYSRHLPWFKVMTKLGPITIGWRKRVINIDWTLSYVSTSAAQLFPNEDVTKWGCEIHAHGYQKAKQYLSTLFATHPNPNIP